MATKNQQPSPAETALTQFSLSVTYILQLWPTLTDALSITLGGTDPSHALGFIAEKTVELFEINPSDTYEEDVEFRIKQIMGDDFEFVFDDDDYSPEDISDAICKLWKECRKGDFAGVEALRAKYERSKAAGARASAIKYGGEVDQETDGEEDDDSEEDEDVEMGDAPELAKAPKEKVAPQVDEDGFTTVVSKKKR